MTLTTAQIESARLSLLDALTVDDLGGGMHCSACHRRSHDGRVAIEHAPECPVTVFAALLAERRQAAELGAWRPIETAPRDRRSILVWCPGNKCMFTVTWGDDAPAGWRSFGGSGNLWQTPTHWMPLPAPPRQAADELAARMGGTEHE